MGQYGNKGMGCGTTILLEDKAPFYPFKFTILRRTDIAQRSLLNS